MQIEQRRVIPQTTFRAKELETKNTTRKQENLKNDHGIVRFRLNIDLERRRVRKPQRDMHLLKMAVYFRKWEIVF